MIIADPATYWNELICTGLFALGLGIFLIVLNFIISKREEDDLEDYVQRQLTRSRSGNFILSSKLSIPAQIFPIFFDTFSYIVAFGI